MEDALEEVDSTSDKSPDHLKDDELGAIHFEAHRNFKVKKLSTDVYVILSIGYSKRPIRDFENYLRITAGLKEDDIQTTLKQ